MGGNVHTIRFVTCVLGSRLLFARLLNGTASTTRNCLQASGMEGRMRRSRCTRNQRVNEWRRASLARAGNSDQSKLPTSMEIRERLRQQVAAIRMQKALILKDSEPNYRGELAVRANFVPLEGVAAFGWIDGFARDLVLLERGTGVPSIGCVLQKLCAEGDHSA